MRRRAIKLAMAALAGAVVMVVVLVGSATPKQRGADPARVISKSDPAKAKLDDELQAKVEAGATASVPVFVTAKGDVSQVKALLDDDKTAQIAGTAIVVGRIPAQTLPKLASVRSVVSVGLVSFKQTGEPLGVPDPLLNRRPSKATLKSRRDAQKRDEVPYSEAPEPRSGHFEELKKLGVMDARTHDFAGAWRAGFAGEGTTVGVLDGGTDFAHPDLLGTWQTWSGASDTATIDDGWNGWPKAFDPFDTLVWLLDPGRVDVGLSWYTPTHGADCTGSGKTCHVDFATRTGPSRNFDAPSGTKTHSYSFPRAWSKSGTVKLGSHPDDYLLQQYLERPAFLVVDAHTAGVYDTVYVDLDDDYSFADEKPVTQGSPASYRDMNGDGLTDLSGGLLYYISDGETRIPGGLTSFLGPDTPAPGAGDLLAWTGDYDTGIEGHGTLTASNIVGQAVINGKAPSFDDLPTKDGRVPGEVIGGSPHAKLAPYGDIYLGFDFSTQFGYLLSTIRGIDVTSNSYGNSDVDNDGYDARSQEADIIHDGSRTTPLFSTGNGAPGYGTTTPPAPSAGIKVGASTQFGATGWDSIAKIGQVVDDDVMVWSNRGPGATGANGVDVVADGAFSSGDITLNSVRNGDVAWETWGGTSRSAPVAASATALVYQAYRQAHPGAVPSGFYATAKTILKSSADDLGYDSFTQGSGSIDAARAVKAAGSGGTTVSPGEWRVGDYRGNEYPVFTHVIAPGASDTQTFTISGPGTWSVSDRYLKRSATETFKVNTSSQAKESAFNFNAPDYLVDISDRVKRHPNADLMVVRALYPHDQFDGDANYETDQDWRLLTYNWTDVNRDHDLWIDRDHDGAVDHTDKAEGEDIDHNALLDFKRSEMEKGEYVRFMYHRPGANSLMSFVRDPRKRMDDGIFLGLQHTTHNPKIDRTNFTIQIDWYENGDWPWLTAPANATGSFAAKLSVPPGTPYGMYDGAIVLSKDKVSTVVPVDVAVAATATQGADGSLTDALRFGGADVAAAQRNLTYDNGSVFGATDWTWRPESGDWRFFFFDVPKAPPAGTLFLADTTWDDAAPFTDLDTLIFGRSENQYQLFDPAPFGGPYILGTVGKSQNTNTGAGVWTFDTATGGPREVVAAPAQEGLQALAQHQVGWQGDKFDASFSTTLGSASVTPSSVEQSTAADSGSFDVTFKANVDLDGLKAEAFGLSQPQTTAEPVAQDDPDDPSTASNKKNLTINHASRLHVDTAFPTEDVDLYVVYDANGDGAFTPDEIVASSAGGTANEAVDLIRPADGNYQIWLHGFQVAETPSIQLTVNAVQGNDLTVTGVPSGAVPAGTAVTLHVAFSKAMTAGQDYFGELLLGPSSAPSALTVPIKISRTA
jgi:subtilase family protein